MSTPGTSLKDNLDILPEAFHKYHVTRSSFTLKEYRTGESPYRQNRTTPNNWQSKEASMAGNILDNESVMTPNSSIVRFSQLFICQERKCNNKGESTIYF